MNKCILIGRLGQDPALTYTGNGTAICKFSVATSDGTKEKPKTNWHNIVVWGKQGENCKEYLSKGSQVCVEGRVETRTYEKDGQKRYITEITANSVEFLSARNGGSKSSSPSEGDETGDSSAPATTEGLDDDMPF